ncbi:hypothetical protein BDN72DRAFT_961935 [Pluteus cervinus]|uniref:Uncharacterized protein n=1 Tax=Pluteus cervinus TaxID=181527 RepID=A0ACD3AKK4_9AGAR|nr:hypothetical protein BDN72DRAFT_961935 [Pluteus cervinus]
MDSFDLTSPVTDVPSSPDTGDLNLGLSEISTPISRSGETSPTNFESEYPLDTPDTPDAAPATQKKKKKKKPKKSAKAKEAAAQKSKAATPTVEQGTRPPVLCISRNKHWRYISSYHGPWLQLPLELLESLLVLNLDPTTLSAPDRFPALPPPPTSNFTGKQRDRGFQSLGDHTPPDSPPRTNFSSLPLPPPFPTSKPGKPTPPPIDPGVFRSVTSIRRLIDEAAELSVRASSGLSAAELGSMRGINPGLSSGSWAAAQSLGINPMGNTNGGRNVAMSAMRIHRLRALAVQKLAQAYKADEIASSVMVMQGGSVFDDVAERVLKNDPNDIDAKYVHFFHEKIPSRQLAESTTTKVLDELIAAQPHRLEFYRTRGIVHCFRDEYPQATKDFTHALREARAARRAKMMHHTNGSQTEARSSKTGKRKKGTASQVHGQASSDGTTAVNSENSVEGPDGEPLLLHPSVLPDAPEPIEPQLLFLRGAAYLQHAVHLIETAVLRLEGVQKVPSVDGAELRLCYIENGKYGGVEVGNSEGPLGKRDGEKLIAYRNVLAAPEFRDQICALLRKCIRDHEKFLSHFDTLESPNGMPDGDLAVKTEYAFLLSESIRPGNQGSLPPHVSDVPAMFTTYHPLLVESHFSILICQLMLAEFATLLGTFSKTAALVDGLEGYPVFLPPRSMGQAEFIEVLERLAGGWKNGIQPHSLSTVRGKGRLAIQAPPLPMLLPPPPPSSASSIVPSRSGSGSGSTGQKTPLPPPPLSSASSSSMLSSFSSLDSPLPIDDMDGFMTHAFGGGTCGVSSSSLSMQQQQQSYYYTSSVEGSSSKATSRHGSMENMGGGSSGGGGLVMTNGNGIRAGSGSGSRSNSNHVGVNGHGHGTVGGYGGGSNGVNGIGAGGSGVPHYLRPDALEALDCVRILLAPVIKRQRERAEKAASEKVAGMKKKPAPINIPLHGPRVEVILAWLGAVHLPEMDV